MAKTRMHVGTAIVFLALCTAGIVAADTKTKIDFLSNGIGVAPTDFEFWQTGRGAPGQWAVIRDPTAALGVAIEQFSLDQTDDRFPLAIYKPISLKNLEITARVKVVRGRMRSAGIAVRLVSPENYYVVRLSAMEERVDLYRVVAGKSERIAGTDADVFLDRWHRLGIRAEGDRLDVSIDGTFLFTAFDRTFLQDGRVALWTEEDNITRFDEIEIEPLPHSTGD